MSNKGKVRYISISESRDLHIFRYDGQTQMEMRHEVCIQRDMPNGHVSVKNYNATESSILRLARIQEKLHSQ